jgi:aspartyl/asparaginyl beta-hydroxylase (cupin superfamily)
METNKTKKTGRPKSEVDHKKICHVLVKFSPNDYTKIEEKSTLVGTTVTAFVRSSALSANVIARPTAEKMEAIRTYNNLRNGIGNNINQLAKLAHQLGYSNAIHQELKNLLKTENY